MQVWYEKNHDFRLTSRFISEMIQDRAIVTMERHTNSYEIYEMNGVISNDFKRPLTQIGVETLSLGNNLQLCKVRSVYIPNSDCFKDTRYSTLNISETIQNRDIVQWNTNKRNLRYTGPTQRRNFE